MTWHKYTEIVRIKERKVMKGSRWKRLFYTLMGTQVDYLIYQHGIQLINEQGETKDVWEKDVSCVETEQ